MRQEAYQLSPIIFSVFLKVGGGRRFQAETRHLEVLFVFSQYASNNCSQLSTKTRKPLHVVGY